MLKSEPAASMGLPNMLILREKFSKSDFGFFEFFGYFGSPGKKEKGKETGPAWEYITTPDLFCSRTKGWGHLNEGTVPALYFSPVTP